MAAGPCAPSASDYATKRQVHLTFGEHRDVPPTLQGRARKTFCRQARDENRRIERQYRQAERLQRAAAMRGDWRVANLESQALEIARATGQIVETLNDELKALRLENLERRTHCRVTECAA